MDTKTRVRTLIQQKLDDIEQRPLDQKVTSLGLRVKHKTHKVLVLLAKELEMSKTSLATQLLEQAILDAADIANIGVDTE